MTYTLVLGGQKHFPLATIRGWSKFKNWVEGLDLEDFDEVITLAEHGLSQELKILQTQIRLMLDTRNPPADIAGIGRHIYQAISQRSSDDVSVFVSDGMGSSDGTVD